MESNNNKKQNNGNVKFVSSIFAVLQVLYLVIGPLQMFPVTNPELLVHFTLPVTGPHHSHWSLTDVPNNRPDFTGPLYTSCNWSI